ncbi:hypothetical protein D8674_024599 [Pyrus ussuriensis x Pyrus communis]|uniref:Uncharacterized protein n=1 Tax=Pyrus ussuriensis x Pyrus communis TaxID=2448454 RepID=A0A5N5H5S2_9ROSA|nr:hypothetical protein D8674_024599 [Pyrus ussuriensis x Pyrus communis]
MVDSSAPSSKRVQGKGSEKDKKKKRAMTCVQYISFAKRHYRIAYAELVRYQKSDMVNKFRGDIRVLRHPRGDKDGHVRCCNYTLDDMNKELMKLMEEELKRGYKQWRYDVEQNGGPADSFRFMFFRTIFIFKVLF